MYSEKNLENCLVLQKPNRINIQSLSIDYNYLKIRVPLSYSTYALRTIKKRVPFNASLKQLTNAVNKFTVAVKQLRLSVKQFNRNNLLSHK